MIEKVRTFIFAVCGAIAQVRVYANSMSDNFEKLADIMEKEIEQIKPEIPMIQE